MKRTILTSVAALAIGLWSTMASAQDSLVNHVLQGKLGQASYEVKDLPEKYQPIALSLDSDRMSIFGLMSMGMTGPGNLENIGQVLSAYWTDGTTVTDETGAHYLVTYTALQDLPQIMKGFSSGSDMADYARPKPRLTITLVRQTSIISISPVSFTRADLLAALAPSPFLTPSRDNHTAQPATQKTVALNNMKQLGLATIMYCNDYDDIWPSAQGSEEAGKEIMPYLKNTAMLKSSNPAGGMIRYNVALSGVAANALGSPAETIAWYDSLPWPDGTHLAAFADGHAKFVNAEVWYQVSKSLVRKTPAKKVKPKKPAHH